MPWPSLADLRDLADRLRRRPPRPRVFPPNRWTPAEVERRIQHEPVEWAYVFGSSGRQIFRARGGEEVVSISLPRSVLRDAILIHNHPPLSKLPQPAAEFGGRSFSDHDVAFAFSYDLAELVAVTPGWRYRMVRPATGWDVDPESAVAYYTEQLLMVRSELNRAVREGRLTQGEAIGRAKDDVMRRMARWASFDYDREQLPP